MNDTTRPTSVRVIADHCDGPHRTYSDDIWWWLPVLGPTATVLAYLLARHAAYNETCWDTTVLARSVGLAGDRCKLWASLDRLTSNRRPSLTQGVPDEPPFSRYSFAMRYARASPIPSARAASCTVMNELACLGVCRLKFPMLDQVGPPSFVHLMHPNGHLALVSDESPVPSAPALLNHFMRVTVESRTDRSCGAGIRRLHEVCVDVRRRGRLSVTESPGSCPKVDSADEHGGCGEVAEVVEPNVTHPLTLGKPGERERGVVRIPRDQAVWPMREHEGIRREPPRRWRVRAPCGLAVPPALALCPRRARRAARRVSSCPSR